MKEVINAPIVLFLYARPDHAQKTLDALSRNLGAKESDLFIFCDGPKKESVKEAVAQVQQLAREETRKSHFRNVYVTVSEINKGLAKSIIGGVSTVLNQYGKCIVVEDDLITSNCFLKFMNDCLEYYENRKNIFAISGFTYPLKALKRYPHDVYLSYRACSHGWATWIDRWKLVDWDVKDFPQLSRSVSKRRKLNRGGNDMYRMLRHQMRGERDSWAIRFCYAQSKHDMLAVYPRETLVRNIGFDGTGTHCTALDESKITKTVEDGIVLKPADVKINIRIIRAFKQQYRVSFKEAIDWIMRKGVKKWRERVPKR